MIATLAGQINNLGLSPDKKTFVVDYTNAPPEVRRTDTGTVIATLPGELSIEKFSPQATVFVANRTDTPAELRRTSDGALLSQLAGQVEHRPGGATFSPDGNAFVANYTDAPAELRRSSDGVLLSQLAGQVEKSFGVAFSPDGSAFVVDYARDYSPSRSSTGLPTELRTRYGKVAIEFADIRTYNISFSPDGTVFLVRHPDKGRFDEARVEIRSTVGGDLLATLVGAVTSNPPSDRSADDRRPGGGRLGAVTSNPPSDRSPDNLNLDLNNSSNGKNGVVFSPDGSSFVVRYDSGRGELWNVRGTPRRLADLGLGLVKAAFVVSSEVEALVVQVRYRAARIIVDVAWLRAMGGDPRQLPAEELIRLACEGPVTSGP